MYLGALSLYHYLCLWLLNILSLSNSRLNFASQERVSNRFDQGTSQFVSTNGLNADAVSPSHRQSWHSNERLPGAVLLARERLLERLRGVSDSTNRLVLIPPWICETRSVCIGFPGINLPFYTCQSERISKLEQYS